MGRWHPAPLAVTELEGRCLLNDECEGEQRQGDKTGTKRLAFTVQMGRGKSDI